MTDKLTKALHNGITVGAEVRDSRDGRTGTVSWTSSTQIAGDVLLKITDGTSEWTAYVRQVEATR